MGTYNKTLAKIACPRCNTAVECEIDLYFGNTSQMDTIPIGSPYPFCIGRAPQNGDISGPGYAECPSCSRDFFCVATIKSGLLVSVQPDLETPPHIPDRTENNRVACLKCHAGNTSVQYFDRYSVCRLTCLLPGCEFAGIFRVNVDGNLDAASLMDA